jgi:CheY-like chemotaxis protein
MPRLGTSSAASWETPGTPSSKRKAERTGLRLALAEKPEIIFLDLGMPDLSGEEVLDRLAADPATSGIPVIVNTAKILTATDRERLAPRVTAILSKDRSSHEAALGALRQALKAAGAALSNPRPTPD